MKKLSRMFYIFLATIFALFAVVGCASVEDTSDLLPKLSAPYVTVSDDGVASWDRVPNAQYYAYKINNGDEKLTDECSVRLDGNQAFKVKAISGSTSYADSDYSQAVVYIEHSVQAIKLATPQVSVDANGVATWNSIPNAQSYIYIIDDGEEMSTNSRMVRLSANQSVKVKAVGNGTEYADSDYSQSVTYTSSTVQATKLATPQVTVSASGVASWASVPNAQSYVYKINNGAEIATTDRTVQLTANQTIKVKAVSSSANYTDSDYSQSVTYTSSTVQATKLATPQVTVSASGVASWASVPNAQSYVYKINDGAETPTTSRTVQLSANQTIKVKAVSSSANYTDSDYSQSVTYTSSTVQVTKLATPQVSVSSDGTASWNSIANAQSYIYKINDGAETPTTSRTVQLSANQTIRVKAVSGSASYTDSDYSQTVKYVPVVIPDNTNSQEVRQYYNGITAARGNELLGQIHDLITKTHTTYSSYEDCKTPEIVVKTDAGSSSAYVMDFYTQEDISKTWNGNAAGTWNREHVWCKSLSNGLWTSVNNSTRNGGSDLHHLRPEEVRLNSTRGNKKFGEFADSDNAYVAYFIDTSGNNKYQGGLYTSSKFEPLDKVKGDVARIVLYVYTHYNTYANVYGTTNGSGPSANFGTLKFTHIMSASNEAAAIELLLRWNAEDPVDSIEVARNNAVFKLQGNRNPFIDHPEYANAIWG